MSLLLSLLFFSLIGGSDYKLIYRHYATLYFVFCVDSSESELGILDLIQVFVETLDKCFENVCELDLIFHADKVSTSYTSFEWVRLVESTITKWKNVQISTTNGLF